ncbi:hypothetical protein AAVH_23077 [Aphelenchoides avenae]|nr:hypothetical protein AAVH_23077 [Aphelenchus avenae]
MKFAIVLCLFALMATSFVDAQYWGNNYYGGYGMGGYGGGYGMGYNPSAFMGSMAGAGVGSQVGGMIGSLVGGRRKRDVDPADARFDNAE